jgi:hypothetical protein
MHFLFRRIAPSLAILGVVLGLVFYMISAALFNASCSLDPSKGYFHFTDYWCALSGDKTYTGQINAGRSWAFASTIALTMTLCFHFLSMPTLFSRFGVLTIIARYAGAAGAILGSFVFSSAHDIVITIAAPLGFGAIIASSLGLWRNHHRVLLSLGITAMAAAVFDYIIWKMEMLKVEQPVIQKIAILLVFVWVIACAVRVLMNRVSNGVAKTTGKQIAMP